MSKKGQALVEFVIILPVLILLFFGSVDFGKIIVRKNELEGIMSDAIDMYKSGKTFLEIEELVKENSKDYKISVNSDDKYTTIKLSSDIKIITPGLNRILGNNYDVSIKRVISNE